MENEIIAYLNKKAEGRVKRVVSEYFAQAAYFQ
jgi:hypothetical protein